MPDSEHTFIQGCSVDRSASNVLQVLQLADQLRGKYSLMGMATSPMALLGLIWIMLKIVKSA